VKKINKLVGLLHFYNTNLHNCQSYINTNKIAKNYSNGANIGDKHRKREATENSTQRGMSNLRTFESTKSCAATKSTANSGGKIEGANQNRQKQFKTPIK
jgi:hypothetical protein